MNPTAAATKELYTHGQQPSRTKELRTGVRPPRTNEGNHVTLNLGIYLRRSRDGAFVRSFVRSCSFARFASNYSSLWPAFTQTVHINALYNESV